MEQLADQIYVYERHFDDLEEYNRSNCLILLERSNLSDKQASKFDFANFILKILNSKLQLSEPDRNSDIYVCYFCYNKNLKTHLLLNLFRG